MLLHRTPPRSAAVLLLASLALAPGAGAQRSLPGGAGSALDSREDFLFETRYVPAEERVEVFVLGSLPELGDDELRRAVRMVSEDGRNWSVTVALPTDRKFTYRYYARSSVAADLGDPDNGVPLSPTLVGKTRDTPREPGKTVLLHSSLPDPTVHCSLDGAAFEPYAMVRIGPGRTPSESRWAAKDVLTAGYTMELYFTGTAGGRDPAEGTYRSPLDAFLVQDGALYTYVPSASVSPQRKDYSAGSPPSIDSAILGVPRTYRVILPRGYAEHVDRRYPVLYLYDGQLMFDVGGMGWDRNGQRLARLVDDGLIGEMIVVAVDYEGANACEITSNRARDCLSPEDVINVAGCGNVMGNGYAFVGFIADELKPLIDSTYRTRPGRETTFAAGFSLGGVYAFFAGWEFGDVFGAVGCQSGSFWVPNFTARVMTEPKHDVRVYLDFADLELAVITETVRALRDNLLSKQPGFVLERDLRLNVGFGHTHSYPDAGRKATSMLTFLYPATAEPPKLDLAVLGSSVRTRARTPVPAAAR